MNIYIDRITGKCTASQSPLTYTVIADDNFNISKTVQVQEGEIQKVNEEGQLLYYKQGTAYGGYIEDSCEETTDSRTVTKTEPREVPNTYTDDEGIEHIISIIVDEPIEWIDNEPVMVPNIVEKVVTFVENPTEFDVTEILKAKYQNLLDSSEYDYIIADIFLSEDDLDLEDKNHSANTGVAIMEILPHGQVKTKEITLNKVTSDFNLLEFEGENIDIYVNDVKMNNNKVKLEASTNKIYLKFTNTTDKAITIKSYAFAY